jgi:hypothetical protein
LGSSFNRKKIILIISPQPPSPSPVIGEGEKGDEVINKLALPEIRGFSTLLFSFLPCIGY